MGQAKGVKQARDVCVRVCVCVCVCEREMGIQDRHKTSIKVLREKVYDP